MPTGSAALGVCANHIACVWFSRSRTLIRTHTHTRIRACAKSTKLRNACTQLGTRDHHQTNEQRRRRRSRFSRLCPRLPVARVCVCICLCVSVCVCVSISLCSRVRFACRVCVRASECAKKVENSPSKSRRPENANCTRRKLRRRLCPDE